MKPKLKPCRPTLLPETVMITGAKVVSGAGRGRTIGIPTLNVELNSAPKNLEHGVFACRISFDGKNHLGAMHFGPRPVFQDVDSLEVHVLDTNITTRPDRVNIAVIAKIRDITNFENVDALTQAIAADISAVRAILSPS